MPKFGEAQAPRENEGPLHLAFCYLRPSNLYACLALHLLYT